MLPVIIERGKPLDIPPWIRPVIIIIIIFVVTDGAPLTRPSPSNDSTAARLHMSIGYKQTVRYLDSAYRCCWPILSHGMAWYLENGLVFS